MTTATKPRFTILRGLGIATGLVFILIAPLIARDEGLSSLDGIAHLFINVGMGMAFLAYGLTAATSFNKLPPRARQVTTVVAVLLLTGFGATLLFAPDTSILSRIVGALITLLGISNALAAYANRRSKPAA